jgi:hypothetical protein
VITRCIAHHITDKSRDENCTQHDLGVPITHATSDLVPVDHGVPASRARRTGSLTEGLLRPDRPGPKGMSGPCWTWPTWLRRAIFLDRPLAAAMTALHVCTVSPPFHGEFRAGSSAEGSPRGPRPGLQGAAPSRTAARSPLAIR